MNLVILIRFSAFMFAFVAPGFPMPSSEFELIVMF